MKRSLRIILLELDLMLARLSLAIALQPLRYLAIVFSLAIASFFKPIDWPAMFLNNWVIVLLATVWGRSAIKPGSTKFYVYWGIVFVFTLFAILWPLGVIKPAFHVVRGIAILALIWINEDDDSNGPRKRIKKLEDKLESLKERYQKGVLQS